MCTCQDCGEKYNIDLYIPDEYWEKITPKPDNKGAGLLCGSCIMKRLEKSIGEPDFFFMVREENIKWAE